MTIKNLHLFDFDGTLFRSPERPDWWKDKGWWGKFESLGPPCVPDHPSADWWVASTVDAAKKSISDPETYAVLATGRLAGRFHKRVLELLGQAGLRFDEVHLTPGGGTLPFKLGLMEKLIEKLGVEKVEVWEDRSEHVGAFESVIKQFGKESEIHLVSTKPHQLECTVETMNPEAVKVARRFQSELLTKSWLMAVRRGWLHLLTVKPKGWPAIFKAFNAVRDFADNLEEQVLWERRSPSISGPTALVDPKLKEAFAKLKEAIAEKRRGAQHWFEVDNQGPDFMGRGSFPKEQGEYMRARYEEHFGEMLTTYVRTKADKAKGTYLRQREAPITELIDKLMELLRADIVKRDKAIKLEEEVVGPKGTSPTKEIFQDAAFKDFEFGSMKVVVTDPKGNGNLIRPYVRILDIAHQLMARRGFASLWYGVMFLQSTDFHKLDPDELRAYEKAGYKDLQSTAGVFHSGEDVVVITAPATDRLIKTICHEMGHRYWYKRMNQGQRARFEELIRVDQPALLDTPIDSRALEDARKTILSIGRDRKQLLADFEDDFRSAEQADVEKVIGTYAPKVKEMVLGTDPIYATMKQLFQSFIFGDTPRTQRLYDSVNKVMKQYTGQEDSAEVKFRRHLLPDSLWAAWKTGMSDGVKKWFREAQRLRYDVEDAALEYLAHLDKLGKGVLDPDESKVLPVSEYARTNIVEAFAEVFAYYCLGVDLDRDQLESFKSVLSSIPERVASEFRARLTVKRPVHRMTPMVHNH